MPVQQALRVAREQGFDLVAVAPAATPVVCRLLDYGKFKYEQAKKEREGRKTQKVNLLRQIRLRPKIGEHDLEVKVRLIKGLLVEGNKVKVVMIFRGREASHPEIAREILGRMLDKLKEVAVVDQPLAVEERQMSLIFSSRKHAADGEERSQGTSHAKA